MEKYTMFVNWKNQYSENEYSTQSNLEEKMELEALTFLTSDYATKLQSSRQYASGTEAEI